MKFHKVFIMMMVILTLVQQSKGFWRRRRRGCGAVNCAWHNWSQWGACNHPCGNAGTQSRSRGIRQHASCGGAGCSGPSTDTRACNRFCHNRGTPQSGYCSCPDEFWGTCCPHPCTKIANCERLYCTTASNQQCKRCLYDRGGNIKAYRLVASGGYQNRICQQLCSWRPDSRYCYPGRCADVPGSCQCASGFGNPSNNCMTILGQPEIMQCLGKVRKMSGTTVEDFVDVPCDTSTTPATVFTNIPANNLQVVWVSRYQGPSMTTYPKPYYVGQFSVGVVEASTYFKVTRGGTTVKTVTADCSNGRSQSSPNTGAHSCMPKMALGVSLSHGDVLTYTVTTKNGGYIRLNNYDSGSTPRLDPHKYYSGRPLSHTASVTFDFRPPVHCSAEQSCNHRFLDLGQPYTKQGSITARWPGWSDAPAGIKEYQLEVFKMKAYGDVLGTELSALATAKKSAQQTSHSVNLVDPGLYCFLLTALDAAENFKMARKFVLFDNKNVVETVPGNDKAMAVRSAAANTSHTWITDLNSQVEIRWTGHFINKFHHQHKLLAAIRHHTPALDVNYENRTGHPPGVRSMEAIPNVRGVTAYYIQYRLDHQAGNTVTSPTPNWSKVNNFKAETSSLTVDRADGDTVRVFVKAKDVIGNEVTDNVLAHVDSSPPDLTITGLIKDGHQQLAVHGTTDLFDMQLEFETFDDHSGIYSIVWELHDSQDTTRIHGSGTIAVVRSQQSAGTCRAPQCTCVPATEMCYVRSYRITPDASKMTILDGRHEADYYFLVTATNNAKLQTSKQFKVTVDTSPPRTGVVKDSRKGQPDIDYQSHMIHHASWDGFFDKESGVMFYQYAFSDKCVAAKEFSPQSSKVTKTQNTWASRTQANPGKYHVTVVAYNHALEPSAPVCSDGVVIDVTGPTLYDVSVAGLYRRPGLISVEGDIYLVNRVGVATFVNEPEVACRNNAVAEDIALFEVQKYPNGSDVSVSLSEKECTELPGLRSAMFLRSQSKLSVSWHSADPESGIADHEVGLSRTGTGVPDVMPYVSTHDHRHYDTFHSGLAHEQKTFLHIKAKNRARINLEKILGPITVEDRATDLASNLVMRYDRTQDDHVVVVTWDVTGDSQRREALYTQQLAIVDKTSRSEVLPFTYVVALSERPGSLACSTTSDVPTCVSLPVSSLLGHFHPSHEYYALLRIETVAGHKLEVKSVVLIHGHGPPAAGLVWESLPQEREYGDIDIQTQNREVLVEWAGFDHYAEEIHYTVKLMAEEGRILATSPRLDSANTSFLFGNLTLDKYKRYTTYVQANTPSGSSEAISDGFVVLPENIQADDNLVYDGIGCPSTGSTENRLDHHTIPFTCHGDIDFQLSSSSCSVNWEIPMKLRNFTRKIVWRLQEWKSGDSMWENIFTKTTLGIQNVATRSDVQLDKRKRYRSSIRLCHEDGCFQTMFSNGFRILDTPPVPGLLQVQKNTDNQTGSIESITFKWDAFAHPRLNVPGDGMAHYEWTIVVNYRGVQPRKQLFKWRHVTADEAVSSNFTVSHVFTPSLAATSCYFLIVRGVNEVGLVASVERQVLNCQEGILDTNIVIDAVGKYNKDSENTGDIQLRTNNKWNQPDVEFTPSRSSLHAVWPSLRHGNYFYKVVTGDKWGFYQHDTPISYQDYHCSAPETLKCGETNENYVNVRGLNLQDGLRYYICILANETVIEFEKFKETLSTVSACSDGVVVDLQAPVQGKVFVGKPHQHVPFQRYTSALHVYWSGFADVEGHSTTAVHTGIADYRVAIGSSAGGVDVIDFMSVGITSHKTITGLTLSQGKTHFVTVKALDYVGRETTVTSSGVTIDLTPPEVLQGHIETYGAFHQSGRSLRISWNGVFHDQESGIESYHWCIGSRPAHCDVTSYARTQQTDIITGNSLTLSSGHKYYITVKAMNGAKMTFTTSSGAIIIDATPPTGGHVIDGTSSFPGTDVDFQSDPTTLSVAWGGFHDGETGILYYTFAIGTEPGLTDVMPRRQWGLRTSFVLGDLQLKPGQKYFTTVEACNWARACTTITSDGVVPDNSPPVVGKISDGLSGQDENYQSSRSRLCAHWSDLHDVHSGIRNIRWWAGTSSGASDVMAARNIHMTEQACATLDKLMPTNRRIYISVEATNGAGLSTIATSDGFLVDTTPPAVPTAAMFHPQKGTLKPGTQVLRTAVHLKWKFRDSESGMKELYLSLMAADYSLHHFPTVKLLGDVEEYTFANVTLYDGERYKFKVIGCNGAGLCTTSESAWQLVDNSPPTPGSFAVMTEHAIDLGRHRKDRMVYSGSTLRLAFLGFADPHSGVIKYYVTAGTNYDNNDLMSSVPVEVDHTETDTHRDEGFVQTVDVSLVRPVTNGQKIYITIWAENKAGLMSRKLHGALRAVSSSATSGVLELVRRCDAQSCQGHCTCAPQDQRCDQATACQNVTGRSGYKDVEVFDSLIAPGTNDEQYTYAQCTLSARWQTTGSGNAPVRYEWSVGLLGQPPGTGILDRAREPIWHDAGSDTEAIHTVYKGLLVPTTVYVFHVRAWYSEDEVAEFSSDGVTLDKTAPELSKNKMPIEVRSPRYKYDTDFISDATTLHVVWTGVFRDGESGLNRHVLRLGTEKGAEDILVKTYPGGTTRATVSGLSLVEGQRYHVTIQTYNNAGLHSEAHSDGFLVDLTPPDSSKAVVFDGSGPTDIDYQSDQNTVHVTWHGFYDIQSPLHHYVVCAGTTRQIDDVIPCTDVGLVLSLSLKPSSQLSQGQKYYSWVKAVDYAGHSSSFVHSDGFIVDVTEPEGTTEISVGTDLIHDGSFEQGPSSHWKSGPGEAKVIDVGKDGAKSVLVKGQLTQTVPVDGTTDLLKLSFWTRSDHTSGRSKLTDLEETLGSVRLGATIHSFITSESRNDWQEHVYYGHVTPGQQTLLIFTPPANNEYYMLDFVSVRPVTHKTTIGQADQLSITVEVVPTSAEGEGYVTSSWSILDPESNIREYQWAVGTVEGGVQLQHFISCGTYRHARTAPLILSHGSRVHVTVKAMNQAGLTRVIRAEPVMVDFTPPEICCIEINGNRGPGVFYVKKTLLSVTWRSSDNETIVTGCEYALGTLVGGTDLQPYTASSGSSADVDISEHDHGQEIYLSLRCINSKDLTSYLVSSPIIVVKGPPNVTNANVYVVTASMSHYPTRLNHQSQTEHVRIGWRGFADRSGIKAYQVRILDESIQPVKDWTDIAGSSKSFCEINGLSLQPDRRYTVQVRAVNHAGYHSDPVETSVSIDTTKPTATGQRLTYKWETEWTINLNWTNVFLSDSSLVYEVSVGATKGGNEVLTWTETELNWMKISGIDHTQEHFVSITAVNPAGLYHTKSFPFSYTGKDGS